jgi:hypothetical protein
MDTNRRIGNKCVLFLIVCSEQQQQTERCSFQNGDKCDCFQESYALEVVHQPVATHRKTYIGLV